MTSYKLTWNYLHPSTKAVLYRSMSGCKCDLENVLETMKALSHPRAHFSATLYEIKEIDRVTEEIAARS